MSIRNMHKALAWCLASMLLLFACSKKEEKTEVPHDNHKIVVITPAQIKNAGITFDSAQIQNVSQTLTVNGMLDVPPQNKVSVSAIIGGYIKSTELLQGMKVKKGQVIAILQNPEFIQLQSDYLSAQSKLKYLEAEYKRQEELSAENASATKVFQQSRAEYQSLAIELNTLGEKLKLINIDPATLSKESIKSTVPLLAPIGGYVTKVNVNLGKFVNPQDVICEIVNTEHLHAELTVFEKDISKIKNGQKIAFYLNHEANVERKAFIYLINREISEDRTVRVHAHLLKEDVNLLPNMYLRAIITTNDSSTYTLPEEAIVEMDGQKMVFVKSNDSKEFTFEAVPVQVGTTGSGIVQVQINDKLKGKLIVTKGAQTVLSVLVNTDEEGHDH